MGKYITEGLREQNKTAYDWLWLAQCIAVDYDGYRTEKGLMGLVDEMAAYIGEARALLDKQRAEDIKEFAERLKEKPITCQFPFFGLTTDDEIAEHFNGIMKQVSEAIDNLAKEMVGERE